MKKGFTLIEVVVALALLIIVVAVVSTAFALNGRVNAAAKNKITAQQVAVNATEEMRYLAINDSTDKNSLLVSLKESEAFGTYSIISSDIYKFNLVDYSITLSFSKENKLVKLHVEMSNGASFETMEWLEYAGS